MILIIGGAFQGKLEFAKKITGIQEGWVDGASCSEQEFSNAKGIYHFQEWIRRCLKNEISIRESLEKLLAVRPELCIVTNELGCGVVPVDFEDRNWRETTGRICTELASRADAVYRVVCGIGTLLKGG